MPPGVGLGLGLHLGSGGGAGAEPTILNVVLVAGQSNADGWCPIDDDDTDMPDWLTEATHSVPDVKVWNGESIDESYNLHDIATTYDATGLKKCNGRNYAAPSGYAAIMQNRYGFADVALHEVAQTIPNLVMCRVTAGGSELSDISNAGKGSWNTDYATLDGLSEKALLRALGLRFAALVSYAETNGYTLNVLGMIFHQGEKDAQLEQSATYAAHLAEMIAEVRSWDGCTNLPIYLGTVSLNVDDSPVDTWNAVIEAAQLAIAQSDDNVYCRYNGDIVLVPEGSAGSADDYHFNSAGCVAFGTELAYAMLCRYANPTYSLQVCGYYARVLLDGGTVTSLADTKADIAAMKAIAIGEDAAWDSVGAWWSAKAGMKVESAAVSVMYDIVSRSRDYLSGTGGDANSILYRDPSHFDLEQPIAGFRPTLSNGILVFNGEVLGTDTKYLTGRYQTWGLSRSLAGMTIIAVAKVIKPTGGLVNSLVYMARGTSAYTSRAFINRSAVNRNSLSAKSADADTTQSASAGADSNSDTALGVYCGVIDYPADDLYLYVNGSLVASKTDCSFSDASANTTAKGVSVGAVATRAAYGDADSLLATYIGGMEAVEWVVFTKALDNTARAAVENYLIAKWGI